MNTTSRTLLGRFYQLRIGSRAGITDACLLVLVVDEEPGVNVDAVVAAGAQGSIDTGPLDDRIIAFGVLLVGNY